MVKVKIRNAEKTICINRLKPAYTLNYEKEHEDKTADGTPKLKIVYNEAK